MSVIKLIEMRIEHIFVKRFQITRRQMRKYKETDWVKFAYSGVVYQWLKFDSVVFKCTTITGRH